jgi:TonB-dependent receptor
MGFKSSDFPITSSDREEHVARPKYVAAQCSMLVFSCLGIFSLSVHAQSTATASVRGQVTEAGTGVPLSGAHVQIGKTTVNTDGNGTFLVKDVAAGHYEITISASGHRATHKPLDIAAGVNKLDPIALDTDAVSLTDMVVTEAASEAQTRFEDKTSTEAVTDTASEAALKNANSTSSSDIIKEVAGVSVSKGANGASTVSVRGIDQRMLRITVDGQRQGGTTNPLDNIPAEIVQSLEVTKTFTPDMDADAVGGVININTGGIIIKDPYEQGRHQINYNVLAPHPGLRNSLTVARPYTLLASERNASAVFTVSFDDLYSRRERISTLREWTSQISPGPAPYTGTAVPVLTLPLIESTGEHRQRGTFVLNSDARFDDLAVFWRSNLNRDWARRDRRLNATDPASGDVQYLTPQFGTFSGVPLSRRNQDQVSIRDAGNLSFGAKSKFNGNDWDVTASYGITREEEPHTLETGFLSDDSYTVSYDISSPYRPRFTFLDEANPADTTSANDPSRYHLDYFSATRSDLREEDGSFKFNVKLNYDGGNYLKFGGKAEQRHRRADINRDFFDASGQPIDMTQAIGSSLVSLRTAGYRFGPVPSARAVADLLVMDPASFALNADNTAINSSTGDYAVTENFWALYGMGKYKFHKHWTLLGGVRVEGTHVNSSGNQMLLDDAGQLQGFTPANASNDYVELLPGLHLRYEPAATLLYRGSITRSMSRPSNADIAPYRSLSFVDQRSRIGSPDLKPYLATNVDFSIDKYNDVYGLVSLALFYKKIDHFITDAQYPVVIGTLGEFIEFKRINGESATALGGELSWQSPTWTWPKHLGKGSLEVNYSYYHGEAHYPTRPGETFPLPRQVNHQAAFKFHELRGPFSLDANLTYRTGWWEDQIAPGFDNYITSAWDADVNGSYKLGKATRITGGVSNIFDAPTKHYAGIHSRMNDWQRNGREVNLGLQWKI